MGYPMSYQRMLNRNGLDSQTNSPYSYSIVADDLRRVETDQRDSTHLKAYARIAGITPEQAKAVLDAFFGDRNDYPQFGEEIMFAWCEEEPERWNTKIGAFYAEIRKEIYGG